MVKIVRFYLPIIVLVLVAAYVGFVFGGHKRQGKIERQLELINYGSWATDVNVNMRLIDLIEAKKYDKAQNLLENLLDDTLACLCLYDKLAPTYLDQKIFDAIALAKKHRSEYPGHKVNPTLATSVERAFKITKKSE